MNVHEASVYADTWSSTTWVVILTIIVLGVVGLLTGFLALVHHSIEHADDLRALPPGPAPEAPRG